MAKEKRINLNMNISALNYPGPNKYKYNYEGASSKAPCWSFSKAERFQKIKPKSAMRRNISVPGPGAYKTQVFIGQDGPIYSFPKDKYNHADAVEVLMEKKTLNYPKPTSYYKNINYVPSNPVYSMPKLERKDTTTDKYSINYPGPWHYNPKKINSSVMRQYPSWSIYKSERDESKQGSPKIKKDKYNTPGPGYYQSKNGTIPQGPQYTMRQRLYKMIKKKNKDPEPPGPGAYNAVKSHFPCEPAYSIGKELRTKEVNKKNEKETPGPANYNVHDSTFVKGVKFTREARMNQKRYISPGPGQYKIPTSFDYIPDYTRSKGAFDPTFKFV